MQKLMVVLVLGCAVALAQPPMGPGGPGSPGGPPHWDRGDRSRGFHGGPPGRWWMDAALVQKLGLSAEQQKRIDEIFQQSRLKLIDVSAALHKEEAVLDPLLAVDRPEEAKVLVQIDRIAQVRAELEKANARMLLGFRSVLNPEQWKKLQSEGPVRPPMQRR